jgi:hypothetical protein
MPGRAVASLALPDGLARWHLGHDDHLHSRWCERAYAIAAYDC